MDKNVTEPLVTVFIAVYNSEAFIAKAIDSILNQSFSDYEILLINDGSTDESVSIIESFKDPRIRLLHNESNKGVCYTRSRGLQEAKGKYLAILDSDDCAVANRLELQLEYLNKHPRVAILGGQALTYNEGVSGMMSPPAGKDHLAMELVFSNIFVNSTVILNKQFALEVGGYKLTMAEDYDLAFRLSQKFEIANLAETLCYYTFHTENISKLKYEEMVLAEKHIILSIHHYLGLQADVNVHHALMTHDLNKYPLQMYHKLLSALKAANRISKKYNTALFEQRLFEKWYEILLFHKPINALFLYFDKQLFSKSYMSFKHLRRMFKASLKSLINF